jgi:lambda family phage tail tape measure protein
VIGAATAIGTAFSDSFKSVIDGSATAQEALAGFFRNIASYFLDMAVQIIQKMITMAILNQVVGLLPGLGSGGSGFNLGGFGSLSGDSVSGASGFLNAASISPFAKGGIVNKPTMFAYANGGAGRFGLMGEAGPEAIMPLSRGSNGKLGVQASGGVGKVVVNVDASGSKAQGDGPKAKQLGSLIGSAVQAELVKQKRPGGLLAS